MTSVLSFLKNHESSLGRSPSHTQLSHQTAISFTYPHQFRNTIHWRHNQRATSRFADIFSKASASTQVNAIIHEEVKYQPSCGAHDTELPPTTFHVPDYIQYELDSQLSPDADDTQECILRFPNTHSEDPQLALNEAGLDSHQQAVPLLTSLSDLCNNLEHFSSPSTTPSDTIKTYPFPQNWNGVVAVANVPRPRSFAELTQTEKLAIIGAVVPQMSREVQRGLDAACINRAANAEARVYMAHYHMDSLDSNNQSWRNGWHSRGVPTRIAANRENPAAGEFHNGNFDHIVVQSGGTCGIQVDQNYIHAQATALVPANKLTGAQASSPSRPSPPRASITPVRSEAQIAALKEATIASVHARAKASKAQEVEFTETSETTGATEKDQTHEIIEVIEVTEGNAAAKSEPQISQPTAAEIAVRTQSFIAAVHAVAMAASGDQLN